MSVSLCLSVMLYNTENCLPVSDHWCWMVETFWNCLSVTLFVVLCGTERHFETVCLSCCMNDAEIGSEMVCLSTYLRYTKALPKESQGSDRSEPPEAVARPSPPDARSQGWALAASPGAGAKISTRSIMAECWNRDKTFLGRSGGQPWVVQRTV